MSDPSLADYVEDLFGGEDEQLKAMRLEAEREGIPTIQVPFELGRLLQILIVQSGARQILEIGTLFGYSTVLMARALPQNGRITSLEVSPKHADIARRNVETAHLSDRAEIVLGPAAESLSGLPASSFDLVFIDADKRSYPTYLDHALRLTHQNSTIVADNVWRSGGALSPSTDDPDNAGIAEFNQRLAREARLLSTIIPTRDGRDAASISVIRS